MNTVYYNTINMSGEVGLRTGNTNTIDLTFITREEAERDGTFLVCLCRFKTLLTFPALFLCGPGRSPRAAVRATPNKVERAGHGQD